MAPADEHITRLSDYYPANVWRCSFSTPPQLCSGQPGRRSRGHLFSRPDEAALAVSRHEVDVAFIWGPTAGYINTHVPAWCISGFTPVAGEGNAVSGHDRLQEGRRLACARSGRSLARRQPVDCRRACRKSMDCQTAPPIDLASPERYIGVNDRAGIYQRC